MQDGDPTVSLGPTKQMVAAAASGTLTLTLTNPIWVVKTRLCLQFGSNVQMLAEHRRYRYEGVHVKKETSLEIFVSTGASRMLSRKLTNTKACAGFTEASSRERWA